MSFRNNLEFKRAILLWFSNRHETEQQRGHISKWDVSNITDMKKLFKHKSTFNEDISDWDVRNVMDMSEMFSGAITFNQPLYKWKISPTANRENMFTGAVIFNQWKGMSPILTVDCCLYKTAIPVELRAIIHRYITTYFDTWDLLLDALELWDCDKSSQIQSWLMYGNISDWPICNPHLYYGIANQTTSQRKAFLTKLWDIIHNRDSLEQKQPPILEAGLLKPLMRSLLLDNAEHLMLLNNIFQLLTINLEHCSYGIAIEHVDEMKTFMKLVLRPETRHSAVSILNCFSSEWMIAKLIGEEEGMILHLLHLMQHSCVIDVNEQSALIIHKVTCIAENRSRIREAKGIETLLSLISYKYANVNYSAMKTLTCLTMEKDNCERLLNSGGVSLIVKCFLSSSFRLLIEALHVLGNLFRWYGINLDSIIKKNNLVGLFSYLNKPPQIVNAMARALAALALHGVDKDLVIEHIGPSRMNMLLRSGSTDQILLWSICNSNTLSESDWDFMEQSKPVFAAMLHICENKEVYAHFQEFASTVLIQCSNAMARCVLNHNQVQGLLKLFSTSPNMQIRVNIIKTLANQPLRECTEEDATFLKCAIHTCVEILSTIHSDNDGRSLCKDALMELMHLSHLLSFSSTLFTDDVEPNMNVFVSFLLSNEDVNILLFALNIIWNMTFRSSAQAKFIETNGMDIIMPLLSREEVQIRRVATAIVCNLSYYNLPHRALLAETPAYLDRLRRSSTDDDMGVQLYAMAALKNIEGDECTVDSFHVFSTMIVNNKPRHANKQPSELIPILSFASDHNEAVRCLAIKELYSFAKSNTYSCCILRELEVIPLLIRLLSDQVSDVKISALKLLHYLASYSCFDEESIKDTGGIPTFIQLLTNDNKDIRSFAANLLLKLSYFRQVQTGEI